MPLNSKVLPGKKTAVQDEAKEEVVKFRIYNDPHTDHITIFYTAGESGNGLVSVFYSDGKLEQWLVLSLIINITGTFGDFSKSMLKRSVGVKDSGHILPGYGGVLDRFDSLIGSAPFVFIFLLYYA